VAAQPDPEQPVRSAQTRSPDLATVGRPRVVGGERGSRGADLPSNGSRTAGSKAPIEPGTTWPSAMHGIRCDVNDDGPIRVFAEYGSSFWSQPSSTLC
jgi:hypothetical protein